MWGILVESSWFAPSILYSVTGEASRMNEDTKCGTRALHSGRAQIQMESETESPVGNSRV